MSFSGVLKQGEEKSISNFFPMLPLVRHVDFKEQTKRYLEVINVVFRCVKTRGRKININFFPMLPLVRHVDFKEQTKRYLSYALKVSNG